MRETLRFALLKTIPVLLGYLFLGIAFGVVNRYTYSPGRCSRAR